MSFCPLSSVSQSYRKLSAEGKPHSLFPSFKTDDRVAKNGSSERRLVISPIRDGRTVIMGSSSLSVQWRRTRRPCLHASEVRRRRELMMSHSQLHSGSLPAVSKVAGSMP